MGAPLTVPRRGLTVDEFDRMGEVGIFNEDDRIELIDGELIQMAPIGGPHMRLVNVLTTILVRLAGDDAVVSPQNPIRLPPRNEPQPDITLLAPHMRRSATVPTAQDILLVIEIADSTLAYDRDTKMTLYARHGIAEAWLFDIGSRRLLVFRDPSPEGYRSLLTLAPEDSVAPRCLPQARLRLSEVWL